MKRLLKVVKSVFKDFDEKEFNENMELSVIPGWDSMNSVNLQLELEKSFGIDFSEFSLGGTNKIGEIVEYLENRRVKIRNNDNQKEAHI